MNVKGADRFPVWMWTQQPGFPRCATIPLRGVSCRACCDHGRSIFSVGALQLLMNRYGWIRFVHVHERVSTKSFVVLIIGNSKSGRSWASTLRIWKLVSPRRAFRIWTIKVPFPSNHPYIHIYMYIYIYIYIYIYLYIHPHRGSDGFRPPSPLRRMA